MKPNDVNDENVDIKQEKNDNLIERHAVGSQHRRNTNNTSIVWMSIVGFAIIVAGMLMAGIAYFAKHQESNSPNNKDSLLQIDATEDILQENPTNNELNSEIVADEPSLETPGVSMHDTEGCIIKKIVFDSINAELSTDEDVISAIAVMIEKYKYSTDSLEFTVYCKAPIPENSFADMNYTDFLATNYPLRYIIDVKFENINTDALMKLSGNNQVSSIHISEPLNRFVFPE